MAAAFASIPDAYRTRRWQQFVNELLVLWDGELDDLWAAVSQDRIAGLVEQAQRVAETARSDEKLRLAAAVVAEVLRGQGEDQQPVETAGVLLGLLERLEAHHLAVLAILGSSRPGEGPMVGQTVVGGWTLTDLEAAVPHVGKLVPVVVMTLTSLGLAVDVGTSSVTYGGLGRHLLGLTEAGAWLMGHLQAYGPAQDQADAPYD
ncbi:MAG: hypothetical protein ACT452_18400 [Microthrixaceae bacterium]